MNILELLRLRSAPWLSLVMSVVAAFTVWAALHRVTITGAVGTFLLNLGLPTGIASGTAAVHKWFQEDPRLTWVSWSAVILALAVGVRYVRAVYNQRESSYERMRAGRRYGSAKSPSTDEGWRHETPEMRAQMSELAKADYAKAAKYDRQLGTFEQASQLRCAATYWLIAAIFIELSDGAPPVLTAAGLTTNLPTVLIVVGAATLAAILVTCTTQEFYDHFEDPGRVERARDTFRNFFWELFFLAFRFALVLLALPLFVLGAFLFPPAPVKTKADADGP